MTDQKQSASGESGYQHRSALKTHVGGPSSPFHSSCPMARRVNQPVGLANTKAVASPHPGACSCTVPYHFKQRQHGHAQLSEYALSAPALPSSWPASPARAPLPPSQRRPCASHRCVWAHAVHFSMPALHPCIVTDLARVLVTESDRTAQREPVRAATAFLASENMV